jgi:hypothetical protein
MAAMVLSTDLMPSEGRTFANGLADDLKFWVAISKAFVPWSAEGCLGAANR